MAGASGEKIKALFKKYGKIALGVHLCVYGTFLTGGCGWLRWAWVHGGLPRHCCCLAAATSSMARRWRPLTGMPHRGRAGCHQHPDRAPMAGCYIAIDNHVDVKTPLQKIGLLSSEPRSPLLAAVRAACASLPLAAM